MDGHQDAVPGLSLALRDGPALLPEAESSVADPRGRRWVQVAVHGLRAAQGLGAKGEKRAARRRRGSDRWTVVRWGTGQGPPAPGARPRLSPNAQPARGSAVTSLARAPGCSQRRCAQGSRVPASWAVGRATCGWMRETGHQAGPALLPLLLSRSPPTHPSEFYV